MPKKERLNRTTLQITLTAVFAALICLFTALVKVPVGPGYVHFGDALLYLYAVLSGNWWAILAGALGEGLADIAGGYAAYAPFTAVIKALMALVVVLIVRKVGNEKLLSWKTVLATLLAGVINVGGYFIVDYILYHVGAAVDVPGNLIQSGGSTVIFVILALIFDKAKIKDRFFKKL